MASTVNGFAVIVGILPEIQAKPKPLPARRKTLSTFFALSYDSHEYQGVGFYAYSQIEPTRWAYAGAESKRQKRPVTFVTRYIYM